MVLWLAVLLYVKLARPTMGFFFDARGAKTTLRPN